MFLLPFFIEGMHVALKQKYSSSDKEYIVSTDMYCSLLNFKHFSFDFEMAESGVFPLFNLCFSISLRVNTVEITHTSNLSPTVYCLDTACISSLFSSPRLNILKERMNW